MGCGGNVKGTPGAVGKGSSDVPPRGPQTARRRVGLCGCCVGDVRDSPACGAQPAFWAGCCVLARGHVGLIRASWCLSLHVPYFGDEEDGGCEENDEDAAGGQDGRGAEDTGERAGDGCAGGGEGEAAEGVVGGEAGEHG